MFEIDCLDFKNCVCFVNVWIFVVNCLDFFNCFSCFLIVSFFFEIVCSSFFFSFLQGPKHTGARRVGGPKSGAPKGVGAQNFALFFPLPTTIYHSFLPLLGEFCVFENVHVWSSRTVV